VSVLNTNINRGVLGRQRFAATLTNGNIVVVYAGGKLNDSDQLNPRFTIVDSSFNTVVAETTIASESVLNSQIGVAALTGGGFAVVYTNTSANIRIAVFSNTGAVVTAPFVPAGWTSTLSLVDVEPLFNGGFVASGNQGGTVRVATYNATGTQINANTTSIGFNTTDTPQIAVLTDNRFVILTRAGNTSAVVTGFNADCTTVGVGPTFSITNPTGSGSGGALSICALSNNEVVLAWSEGGSNFVRKYFITSNTIGAGTGLNGGSTGYSPTVTTLPGDNIAALMQTSNGQTILQIISSSFANISNTTYNGISLDTLNGNRLSVTGILVGSTLTYFASTVNTGTNTGPSTPIQYYQFGNTAPYAPVYRRTQTINVATAASAVSGYSRGTSTPNSAAFLAATNTTVSSVRTTINGSNYVRAPYIARANVAFLDTCVMSNGRMIVAYSNNTTAPGFLVVDALGNVLSDIAITAPTALEVIRCTALNNGRLLVAFANTNQNITFQVYDENFTLLATNDFVTMIGGVIPNNTNTVANGSFTVSSIGTNRFIVGYCHNSASRAAYAVFTDSLALVVTGFFTGGTTGQAPQVAGNIDGTFTTTQYTTGITNGTYAKFIQTSSNTFEEITQATFGWPGGTRLATTSKMSPNGVGCHPIAPAQGDSARMLMIANPGQVLTVDLGSSSNYMSAAVAIGATGEIVALKGEGGTNSSSVTVIAPGTSIVSGGPIIQNPTTLPSMNTTTGGAGPCICLECLYDRTYAFVYRGSSSELYIGLFSTANITYSATLVAGVTGSTPSLLLSPTNGYYLSGVAASDCAAGGTGVVQVNGAATLNSQYSATTTPQAFDFNTPALDVGVRGTIAGRNMIISGGK
jgi:hypothetical protein